jgi:hypothetical protein
VTQGPSPGRLKPSGMQADDETSALDPGAQALIRRTWSVVAVMLTLVVTLMAIVALFAMRYVGHDWSEQDVVECQSSEFVDQAARSGASATEAALTECVAHRRAKRWGPWGALGNGDDQSRYNGADD